MLTLISCRRFSSRCGRIMATIATDPSSVVTLNDGVSMPLFGLGVFRAQPGQSTEDAVCHALHVGYKMIDTAQIYKNEADVGRGIRKSGVRREDVFVVSKVWNDYHGYEATIRSVQDSLTRLQMSYVDLFLIHSPGGARNVETFQALLDLKSKGLIRSAGVSNFGAQHMEGLRNANLPLPSVNQIELHAFQHKEPVVKYCIDNGVAVMGYSPLAQGRQHDDPDLVRISQRVNKAVSQVMIRWSVQHGYITIPKSTNPNRIKENADVFDFSLTQEEMNILDSKPTFICGWDPTVLPWDG